MLGSLRGHLTQFEQFQAQAVHVAQQSLQFCLVAHLADEHRPRLQGAVGLPHIVEHILRHRTPQNDLIARFLHRRALPRVAVCSGSPHPAMFAPPTTGGVWVAWSNATGRVIGLR